MRPHERLVVRRAHHDAVLVGQLAVQGIVFVERAVPHRRPQVVAAQSQDELEDLLVERVVVAAEALLRPTGAFERSAGAVGREIGHAYDVDAGGVLGLRQVHPAEFSGAD